MDRRLAPHRWFVAAAALVCVAVYADVLFAGRTFLSIGRVPAVYESAPYSAGYEGRAAPRAEFDPGAHVWQEHPWAYAERRALASGALPLWDRFNGLGHPLLANGLTQTWNPLHALVLLNPDSGLLWDIHFLLLRFLAALFSCYLLWELGVRPDLCILGAAYGGVNPAFSILVNRADLEAYTLFPALLLFLFRLRRDPRIGNASALTATLAMTMVAGHPEASFACLFVGGGIAAALAVGARRTRARFVVWSAFAGGIAVLITAPYWLPFLDLLAASHTTHAPGIGVSARPPGLVLQWLFPAITAKESKFALFDDPPAVGFLGAALSTMVAMAFVGAVLSRSVRARVAWIVVPVILALKLFGVPGVQWVGALPFINRMLTEVYFPFPILYSLSVAGLVAVSTLSEEPPRRRTIVLGAGALALLILTLLAPRIFPAGALTSFWDIQRLWTLLVIGGVVALVALIARRPGSTATAASIALCIVVTGDLAIYRSRLSTRGNLTAVGPYIAWLKAKQKDQPPFHVIGFGWRLMPNMATAFALEDVRITDAILPAELMGFVRRFLQKDLVWGWFLSAELRRGFDPWNPILDWLNVRYIVAGPEILAPDSVQLSLLRAGHAGWSAVAYSIDGRTLPLVFQHPNDEGSVRIAVPREYPILSFELAQDPVVWGAPGDGATYEIGVDTPKGAATLFSRAIDPKRNPADRHWIAGQVDLSRWAGSEVTLIFRALSSDARSDWGGWGDLHWQSALGERQPQGQRRSRYDLVYRDPSHPDTVVFENRDAWPRVFASDHPFIERNAGAVLERIQSLIKSSGPHVVAGDDFPVRRWESLRAAQRTGEALRFEVRDVRHGQNDMEFSVDANRAAAVVVAEMLAPGWHATVDGASEPLFRANSLFRGLIVSAGKHQIRLWYWPRAWTIAFALCATGFALWIGTALTVAHYRARSRVPEACQR